MKKYTIEEIRKYLLKQDSMGDILYNLSEAKVDAAQIDEIEEDEEDYDMEPGITDSETGIL